MDGLSRIVKGYRDRIQRASGSVIVGANGDVVANTPTGVAGRLRANGANILSWGDAGVTINTGTLAVSGTGTHSFSGPVKVGISSGVNFAADATAAGDRPILNTLRNGAARFGLLLVGSNDDMVFRALTGVAGSEIPTEALRIVNANGYVSVATRLGVGTASPNYACHIVGDMYATNNGGIGTAPTTTARLTVAINLPDRNVGFFAQTGAGATVPVLVVKGGATPGAGGDLQQWQDSGGAVKAKVDANGVVSAPSVALTGTPVIDFTSRSTTPGNPGAGVARMWYDDTAKAFKYIDSAGTVRTITAA